MTIPSSHQGFSRLLYPRGDRTLIKSVCSACGHEIIGTLYPGPKEQMLEEYEKQHSIICAGKAHPAVPEQLPASKRSTGKSAG